MQSDLDYYQENVIDLSRTAAGIGDIDLALRYQWLGGGPVVLATEARVKTPTGYDGPVGTFGDQPASIAEFTSDIPRFTRPGNQATGMGLPRVGPSWNEGGLMAAGEHAPHGEHVGPPAVFGVDGDLAGDLRPRAQH